MIATARSFASSLYESLPFPVLVMDARARLLSFNQAAGRAFGWNRGLAGDLCDVPVFEDRISAAETLARLSTEGRENVHPIRFRHIDGSVFEATAHILPVEDADAGAGYALVMRSLLSGGSHGEQVLIGQRINSALDTMPEGFAVFDRSERLVLFNRVFRERCGAAREAVRVGVTLESIVRANIRAGLYTGIEDGTQAAEDWVAARLDDHRNADSVGAIFPYGYGQWMRSESHVTESGDIVAVRIDITELKRAEAVLEAQTRELRHKNEALDQFTATVSHDLKAPLRHLSMFSEMMSEDLQKGELDELQHYADNIRKSSARMRRLVDSLLEYAQIAYRIVALRPVALDGVVRDALLLLESHVQETEADIAVGALPEVVGDPELLKRLAQNLIGNALKYRKPDQRACVRVYGEGLCFIVEDEGIGIDARFRDRIFDIFQRLHRDETMYQGAGVGLALVKRIVESHNGSIALDTTYHGGARFVVTFPHSPRG